MLQTRILLCMSIASSLAACGAGERAEGQREPAAEAPSTAAVPSSSYRVYVTNEMSGDMTVIDDAHRVVATIPLGKRPRGIQLSPDGKHLFVALSGSPVAGPDVDERSLPPPDPSADGIGVFDLATQTLTRIIRGVAARSSRSIQIPTNRRAWCKWASEPWGLALSPDGQRLYTANGPSNDVSVVDAESFTVIAIVPAGSRPWGVVVVPAT